MDITTKLDVMYGEFLETKHSPIQVYTDNLQITLENFGQDAFALKEASSGGFKTVIVEKETDKDFGIVRIVFGYYAASKMIEDFNSGVFSLSLVKNALLTVAAKHFLLDFCETVSFKRPGGGYFMSLEEKAGIELILYVSKTKPPEGN